MPTLQEGGSLNNSSSPDYQLELEARLEQLKRNAAELEARLEQLQRDEAAAPEAEQTSALADSDELMSAEEREMARLRGSSLRSHLSNPSSQRA